MDDIFCQIVKKDANASIRYENEVVLAFDDIAPAAPLHVIVVPKKHYIDFSDFISNADQNYIAQYFQSIKSVIRELGLSNKSYRLISNRGTQSGQSVSHFHTHIISGKRLYGLI